MSFFENVLLIGIFFVALFILIIFILLAVAISTLVERKAIASVQRRSGPNTAGFFGFLQPIADGLKLLTKEFIMGKKTTPFVFLMAPVFSFFLSFVLWTMIPFGFLNGMFASDYSLLFFAAFSSLGVYSLPFAGWSSNSSYAFLGALRSVSQMISYEISLSIVYLTVILFSGSANLVEMVSSQSYVWFIFPLFPLWIIFFIVSLAELNSVPFDLPEAEAELVAGFNVEYSSLKFALFFLAEYSMMFLFGAMSSLLFFGGWLGPFGGFHIVYFAIKISLHMLLFMLVRATLPRYRYDQLIRVGWTVFLPLSCFFFVLF